MPRDSDFADFYAASYGRTLALAMAVLGDRREAEDVAPEAFARALLRWPVLRRYDSPEAWVRRVALRLTVDARRRAASARRAMRSASMTAAAPVLPDVTGDLAIGEALLGLPFRQREVVFLHYYADLTVAQIARELRLPESTVKARLASGRGIVRPGWQGGGAIKDDDLRDRLSAWARPVESAPPPPLEVIHRRAWRRAKWVTAVTASGAAACVLVAVALPGLLSGARHEHRPTSSGTGWQLPVALAGPDAGSASAPFFIMFDQRWDPAVPVLYHLSQRQPQPRRVAAIRLPDRNVTPTDVVAAGDDRTFLLTGNQFRHGALITRYYEVRLDGGTRPARVVPLRIGVTARPEGGVGFTALSPDGTELAITVQSIHTATIAVVSLATGRVTKWSAPGRTLPLLSLSWVSDEWLAFLWTAGRAGPQIRVLDAGAPGGGLLAGSRVLVHDTVRFGRFSGLASAPITATRSSVFALMSAPRRPPYGAGDEAAVVAFSVRTGRPERVIAQSAQGGMGAFCGVLWADQSGRQVVTSCGYRLGSTRDGRFSLWTDRTFWLNLKYVPLAW